MMTVHKGLNPYLYVKPLLTDLPPLNRTTGAYKNLMVQVDARLIIEVGAREGLCALRLADFLRRQGEGVLFAVDTWLGTGEDWNSSTDGMRAPNGYPQAYPQFLSNVMSAGLARYVVPFPTTSRVAAGHLASKGVRADLIHIGAAHDHADAAEEIERWWPLMRPCGALYGESGSARPGAQRAAAEFTDREGLKLRTADGTWSFAKPGPACRAEKKTMKLIVNSHALYWKALNFLLKSLVDAHWARWHDVVIFFGGSRQDIPPRKGLHSWAPGGITIANVTLNSYDYNALSGLYRFRNYPEIQADVYLYTHDTTTVVPDFPSYFAKAKKNFPPGELRLPRLSSSNVMVFASDLVRKYRHNFDVNLTKGEAVSYEVVGAKNVKTFDLRGVRHLGYFAKSYIRLARRVSAGRDIDIYGTGHKRQRFLYPDLGIIKYLFKDQHGDLTGGKVRKVPKVLWNGHGFRL